jgi:hypothetical protein
VGGFGVQGKTDMLLSEETVEGTGCAVVDWIRLTYLRS